MAGTRVIIQSTATHIIKYVGDTQTNMPVSEIEYLYAFTEKERQDVQDVYNEYAEKRRIEKEEIEERRIASGLSNSSKAIYLRTLRASSQHRTNEVTND